MYKKKHCSRKRNKLSYSCMTKSMLKTLARKMNKITKKKIKPTTNMKRLYRQICDISRNEFKCNNETCWLNIKELQDSMTSKELKEFRKHFRPMLPKDVQKDYNAWLSNFDIDGVMGQLVFDHGDFHYYDATPIDFHKCEVSDLCSFDLQNHHRSGKKKIGMVFNTDRSDQSGTHWIAMYIDSDGKNLSNTPGIYYFDSYNNGIPQQITDLIDKIKNQGKKNNIEFIVTSNDQKLQKNNYSCGYYCMHFLENMVKEFPFSKYKKKISDDVMNRYRFECFIHPKEIK